MKLHLSATFIAASALAFGLVGGAHADDITIDPVPFVSTKSRAQVQAELREYKRAGVNPWSMSYNPLASFRSTRSRAEVTGEFLANRDHVRALNGEDSGSAYLAAQQAKQADRAATQLAGEDQPAN
jgi:hypothetical protein